MLSTWNTARPPNGFQHAAAILVTHVCMIQHCLGCPTLRASSRIAECLWLHEHNSSLRTSCISFLRMGTWDPVPTLTTKLLSNLSFNCNVVVMWFSLDFPIQGVWHRHHCCFVITTFSMKICTSCLGSCIPGCVFPCRQALESPFSRLQSLLLTIYDTRRMKPPALLQCLIY